MHKTQRPRIIREFRRLRERGVQAKVVVARLAGKYQCSRASIYRRIKGSGEAGRRMRLLPSVNAEVSAAQEGGY